MSWSTGSLADLFSWAKMLSRNVMRPRLRCVFRAVLRGRGRAEEDNLPSLERLCAQEIAGSGARLALQSMYPCEPSIADCARRCVPSHQEFLQLRNRERGGRRRF